MASGNWRCFGCAEAAPEWPAAYRSPHGLAVALFVLLGLDGLISLGLVATDLWAHTFYGRLIDGTDDVDSGLLDTLSTLSDGLSGLAALAMVATAVVFVIWFYRVRQNADLLTPNGHRLGKGWTIGAWITPLVHLWFPWRLMVDCWQASAPPAADGRRRTMPQTVLTLWWSAWVGSLVIGRISNTLADSSDLDIVRGAVLLEAVGETISLVAAVLAIVVVHRLTSMQQARRTMIDPFAAALAVRAVAGHGVAAATGPTAADTSGVGTAGVGTAGAAAAGPTAAEPPR
ncbi:DUF4328 domain-containing protein [Kitasatospora sp. NPDC088351]|uniref:DUF4328 domain-containing protein n=1 Tax=Kitasatospora sp. NPDC088351 TaxID=3155180 RepID=UPI0034175763